MEEFTAKPFHSVARLTKRYANPVMDVLVELRAIHYATTFPMDNSYGVWGRTAMEDHCEGNHGHVFDWLPPTLLA